jgi:anthraniloyl-CoA monooxygenase
LKILCVGGGPAGLYFGILMKQSDPTHEITIFERNRSDDTFGFGVVFSERTLSYLQNQDEEVYRQISRNCQGWDPIEVHFKGTTLLCGGNGFSAISRKRLLNILQVRALELGVNIRFSTEFEDMVLFSDYDLVVAADGANSLIRRTFAEQFRPTIEIGKAKYAWFGTTKMFHALTFLFEENEHGIFGVHAYPFDEHTSTFIIETDEDAWHRAELDRYVEDTFAPGKSDLVSMAYCQKLFARYLDGHDLLANNSKWLNFRTVRNESWHYGHIVLIGDAAHTAHFSVGSGSKMAMEDAIALCQSLKRYRVIPTALEEYEQVRRPEVERIQRASRPSQAWWENFRRYKHFAPEQFVFNFLTRNPRITYEKLEQRDLQFITRVNRWFTREMMPSRADKQREIVLPLSVPFQLGHITLVNRIALSLRVDQVPGDHVGISKAGLVILELPGDREVPGEQLQQIVNAIRTHSSARIGLGILFRYLQRQPAEREQADVAVALQLAGTIEADLLELDCTQAHVPLMHIPDTVRAVLHDEADGSSRNIRSGLAPALAVRIATPGETEGVTDDKVLEVARLLKQHGCNLMAIAPEEGGKKLAGGGQLHQRLLSDRVRNEVGFPTMLVRESVSADEINTDILAGRTDLYLLQALEHAFQDEISRL